MSADPGPDCFAPLQPLIVGIGGGATAGSSTDQALSLALESARLHGARIRFFGSAHLAALPMYMTASNGESHGVGELIGAVREASGLILASPGYHGTLSGMVKNAIDHLQDTAADPRPYLTDLPVGLIAVAGGYQAAVSTLATLRTIVHALRGWPTPLGAAINTTVTPFRNGTTTDRTVNGQIETVGRQVASFARRMAYAAA